jgi:hypothetical protein
MDNKGYDTHVRNLQAEAEYIEKLETDEQLYKEVIQVDEITITSYNYSKNKVDIYALLGRSRDED